MTQAQNDIPNPAVRRLSLYLRQLELLQKRHVPTVSSSTLASSLSLTDAQVRKDLAYFGQFGRPGVGYEVVSLIQGLKKILGTDRVTHTLVVGMGNLGRALAAYQGFAPKGFQLVALFDMDKSMISKSIDGIKIQPMRQLTQTINRLEIRLAIMAVPADSAQAVADQLVSAGIRGILNFAPLQLRVPADVAVRGLDVAAELEQLSFQANR